VNSTRSITEIARRQSVLPTALKFHHLGYSLIPILPNGTKAPAVYSWKCWQFERAGTNQLEQWFASGRFGIGVIHGAISGNSELIDVDKADIFDELYELILSEVPEVAAAPLIETPRPGYQLYTRCSEPVCGNIVLARYLNADDGKVKAAVETRGEGGYSLAPGSPPGCHPTGRPYKVIAGRFGIVPVLTQQQRARIHAVATEFDERPEQPAEKPIVQPPDWRIEQPRRQYIANGEPTIADVFNRSAQWSSILLPHGWRLLGTDHSATSYWKRPGKSDRGHSATTNYYPPADLLHVFSTSAEPFVANRSYSKFSAHALLYYGGDIRACALALAKRWRISLARLGLRT
jgi:putative DNA primase/helicase